ncbi:hypothetical protein HanPI659440_Chr10g0386471 [Helianthus annuus]|nr:hypothetical protein HanPI659440_Chr10g0386471 [Helianthus annuus]
MKISSKSLLSPGRAGVRDPPISLSTSLSRRLKNSGSVKGGASPAMFPTTVKKRGTFENPEPSSPKVTCIGQVRVRGKKKQAKKLRTLSRRHSGYSDRSAGEVSFRKVEHPLNGFCSKGYKDKESLNLGPNGGQNQSQSQSQECSQVQRSWVHFPVTICEALRAFGSEFSCLIPCKTERGKEEKMVGAEEGNRQGSCGAVFARWLVAVQDGDGGGERDIELVVGDEDEEDDEEEEVVVRKRRHVFEDLEIVNGRIEGHKDEARVSVCVPPKNALLLMRCRSDPMKSEALVNRSWEPSVARNEEEDEEFFDSKNHIENDSKKPQATLEVEQQQVMVVNQDQENVQQIEAKQYQEHKNVQQDDDNMDQDEANQDQELDNVQKDKVGEDQELANLQKDELGQDQELDNVQKDEVGQDQELDNVQNDEAGQDQELDNVQNDEAGQDQEHDNVKKYEVGQDQEYEQTEVEEESFYLVSLFEEIMNQDYKIQEHDEAHEEEDDDGDVAEIGAEESTMATKFAKISETHEEEMVNEVEEHNNGVSKVENEVEEKRVSEEVLPDCLLLMMHEPKLSINVSKETWVCSTDFIRRNSYRRKPPAPPPPIKPDGGDESSVGATTTTTANDMTRVCNREFPTVLQQPARSSCSLPMAASMATVIEQKLANAVGYEPFVLTRCKSEPMKTAASKLLLVPESCVWENRKLEGLSRVTFGLGF